MCRIPTFRAFAVRTSLPCSSLPPSTPITVAIHITLPEGDQGDFPPEAIGCCRQQAHQHRRVLSEAVPTPSASGPPSSENSRAIS